MFRLGFWPLLDWSFFASWVSVPVATAASWRGTTGVVGRFIFSDNLFLSETDEETGGIIQVLPFVSSARNGRRVRATFNYGPSILWYPGNSDLNNVAHVLRATIRTEVIERYFFLDVTAQANQALINPRLSSGFGGFGGSSGFGGSTGFGGSGFEGGTGGFGSAVNPEAFTQTASIEVRPRIVLPIAAGRFATVRIEPGLALVATAETADGGGRSSQPQTDSRIRVVSGSMFTTIPWSINARRQLFDAETDQGSGRIDARVGYIFSPRYRVDLVLGYDDGNNSFQAEDGNTSGPRWELWFGWTPKPSSRFEIGAGQAYYGDLFRLRANHRHKRWAFRARYDVEIQDARSEILQQDVVPVEDIFGNPIVDPITGGNVTGASITTPVLIDDTFLRDRFELDVGYSWGRNGANWRWYVTRRDYNESDLETLDSVMRFSYSRRLSVRLSATANVYYWDYSEEQDEGFDFTQNALQLGVDYALGARTRLGASIGRQRRDSQAPDGSFSENRVTLSLTYNWGRTPAGGGSGAFGGGAGLSTGARFDAP